MDLCEGRKGGRKELLLAVISQTIWGWLWLARNSFTLLWSTRFGLVRGKRQQKNELHLDRGLIRLQFKWSKCTWKMWAELNLSHRKIMNKFSPN